MITTYAFLINEKHQKIDHLIYVFDFNARTNNESQQLSFIYKMSQIFYKLRETQCKNKKYNTNLLIIHCFVLNYLMRIESRQKLFAFTKEIDYKQITQKQIKFDFTNETIKNIKSLIKWFMTFLNVKIKCYCSIRRNKNNFKTQFEIDLVVLLEKIR